MITSRPDVEALRSRIRELIRDYAPLPARDAYRILTAEGWSAQQIGWATRGLVTVRGLTKAAVWVEAAPEPMGPKRQSQTAAEKAARQREKRREAREAKAAAPARRAASPSRLVTTACAVCRTPLVRPPGVRPVCDKPLCRDAAA